MNTPSQRPLFDRKLVRTRQWQAHRTGTFPTFLHDRAVAELTDRFEGILRQFEKTALAGLLDAQHITALGIAAGAKYLITMSEHGPSQPDKTIQLVVDLENMSFANASLDCLVCVFGLEQVNDLAGALVHIRQSLVADGLFLAVLPAGDTAHELRTSWLEAETEIYGGASPRVAPFAHIRDLGALLQRAGFALPVVDSDRITLTYDTPLAAMRELKQLGWSNALSERSRKPVTRGLLMRAAEIYADRFATPDGRVPLTMELIYLTGWVPHESQQKPLKPGSARMRLADALKTSEHPLKK